jgi:(p)ppGpp synthase/HD superfamily hydrolase
MNIAFEAMMFARDKHRAQQRKYTGNPYADHLAEVAGIVATVPGHTCWMIAVAWLHDSVEDQGVTAGELFERFGYAVASGVMQLSDLETGNRAERKAAGRVRLASAPGWVQTIKCADLISNTSSIVMHDPQFAGVYLEEKRLLLDVMDGADPGLRALARAQAGDARLAGKVA